MRGADQTRWLAGSIYRHARRWLLFRLRPESLTLNGVTLELGRWATDPIRRQIYDGSYESPERAVIMQTVAPDDTVLEVGCGTGYMTTIAARIARTVKSFDANPELVEVARATVAQNGVKAEILAGVLDRAPSSVTSPFYITPNFPESSLRPQDNARPVDVRVFDFMEQCRASSYLLMDVEGAEVDLLRGDLPGIRAICVECHPRVVTSREITEMLTALFAQGFLLDLTVSRGQVLYLWRPTQAVPADTNATRPDGT